ncbi:MAG: class I SAM-dependent methyltransferase [bacterium]|jgi:SAM-dependent methyltransferase/tetratricopeptide (TPR) repeat protein|nr:class I SAM-dependent methyltransferase [bacterium]
MSDNRKKQVYAEALERAFHAYHAKQRDAAETALREAIGLAPDVAEGRVHLANLYAEQLRYQEAADILRPVQAHPGVDAMLDWNTFMATWSAGDRETAGPVIQKLLHRSDLTTEQRRLLKQCAKQNGDFQTALQLASGLGPDSYTTEIRWQMWLLRGLRLVPPPIRPLLLRRIEGLLRRFQQWTWMQLWLECACATLPRSIEWPKKLGANYRQIRDPYNPQFQQEARMYQEALWRKPGDPDTVLLLLRILYDMGQWQAVLDLFQAHPVVTWPELEAVCLMNLGQTARAVPLYQAIVAQSASPVAALALGLIALEEGDGKTAQAHFAQIQTERGPELLGRFFSAISEVLQEKGTAAADGQWILDRLAIAEEVLAGEGAIHAGPCWLCGNDAPRIPLWRDTQTGWLRSRCPACSMISVFPPPAPEAIQALYTGAARKDHTLQHLYKAGVEPVLHAPEAECRRLPCFQEMTDWGADFDWAAFEQSLGHPKRMLDIGCSAGKEVQVFLNCGWQAEGIDLDDDAVAYGQSRGIPLRVGTVEDLESRAGEFHLIVLLDVIEHIADPAGFLRRCQALLAPGGVLFLKTPCADSLPHAFVGSRWLEASEHLHFFSRKTLRHLVERSGLEWIACRQTMEAPTPFLHEAVWQSRFYPQALYTWIGRLHVGDTLAALAQKPKKMGQARGSRVKDKTT